MICEKNSGMETTRRKTYEETKEQIGIVSELETMRVLDIFRLIDGTET